MPGGDTAATRATPPSTSSTVDALRSLGVVSARGADSLHAQGFDCRHPEGDPARIRWRSRTGLQVFGLEVFRRRTREFAPALAGPIDPGYVLGPGDLLVLVLTGDVETSASLEVNREGFVLVPQVGQVQVANLTLGQATDLLYSRLTKVYSGIGTRAECANALPALRRQDPRGPDLCVWRRRAARAVPGGGRGFGAERAVFGGRADGARQLPQDRGAPRDRVCSERSTCTTTCSAASTAPTAAHFRRCRVRAAAWAPGEGYRRDPPPGHLRACAQRDAARPHCLRRWLHRAGADDSSADQSHPAARCTRHRRPGSRGHRCTGEQLAQGIVPPYPHGSRRLGRGVPGDPPPRAVVLVQGNVWLPGPVGFTPGMKLGDAIRLAGGPKADVFLGDVLVTRLLPDSTRMQLRRARSPTRPGCRSTTLRWQRTTRSSSSRAASSAVSDTSSSPARCGSRVGCPIREGMTLRDAALLADGLRGGCLPRLCRSRATARRIAPVAPWRPRIRVPLDSTYVFDRSRERQVPRPAGSPGPGVGRADLCAPAV